MVLVTYFVYNKKQVKELWRNHTQYCLFSSQILQV